MFFFFTQYLLHSVAIVWKLYNSEMKFQHTCVLIESPHKYEGWKFNLFSSTLLNGQMISCFYWLSMVFSVITYLLGGGAKSELFFCVLCVSKLLVLEAVAYIICQNMWISLFQGYNLTLQH